MGDKWSYQLSAISDRIMLATPSGKVQYMSAQSMPKIPLPRADDLGWKGLS
jgi:hypothetical protein